ncbi:MAG: transglycosylase domain-containing protein [Chloroflexi bacterium]|nr:transglycosylase domain-containing protein [Chloroflexota bacterium]
MQFRVIALGILGVVAAVFAVAALPLYFSLIAGLPAVEQLAELLDPTNGELLQSTRIYDRNGENLILTLAPEGIERHFEAAANMPWLAKAYVVSHQPNFWQENPLNWDELTSPPNTIAEYLVTRLLLSSQPEGWVKNLRTSLMAAQALDRYGPEQILTWALNSTDFGHWTFGAESAAQLYFGKPASELTLAESALLAAVAQAPALNPIDAPELAIRFQRLVLTAMREQGLISEAEFTAAVSEQLVFSPVREPVSRVPDFTDLAIQQLETELGHERVARGGLDVITTLDYALQQEVADLIPNPGKTSLVIVDSANGRLLASLGDVSSDHKSENLLSPFSYLSAFAQGLSPSSLVWDVGEMNDNHSPGTVLSAFHGPVTLRRALANQYVNIEMSLLEDAGISRYTIDLMQALGLDIFSARGMVFQSSAALQELDLSVLEASKAYSVFSQNGLGVNGPPSTPNTLLFAAGPNGSVEFDFTHVMWQSIISPDLVFLVNDILSDKTFFKTINTTRQPAAFFSDPSQQWLVAYSPKRVVVSWTEKESKFDSTLWLSLFEAAHRGLPVKDWEIPAGLTSTIVCVPSGQLPDDDCPETRREWFLHGAEPTETDSLYQRIAINRLNGKLATVFTPEEFVEDRVYLMVPPEAEVWAKIAGIPLPPRDYDPVSIFVDEESGPAITEPAPFTSVEGIVEIIGSLGPDTAAYDVQVGQGLRPGEWLLIAEGETAPSSGELAEWNSDGLSGVWAMQLQTWDVEGGITRAYTIVTIETAN